EKGEKRRITWTIPSVAASLPVTACSMEIAPAFVAVGQIDRICPRNKPYFFGQQSAILDGARERFGVHPVKPRGKVIFARRYVGEDKLTERVGFGCIGPGCVARICFARQHIAAATHHIE